MLLGKSVRMERIIDRGTGRAVIVPMDHGISMGPVTGLVDLRGTIEMVSQGGATSIVLHKGAVPYSHRSYGRDIGLILHLSASTNLGAGRTIRSWSPPWRRRSRSARTPSLSMSTSGTRTNPL